ncbi:hypothetical protein LX36DRAFT_721120 [Colletotrichum falcatum]|nr:hypothetical protein LX36DRAFT_721120 [Colletotrichum falcatum]
MHLSVRSIVTLAALLRSCHGVVFTPPDCAGDIKEFPNCDRADSIARDCKGELRQCVLGNSFDSVSDDLIAEWRDACGPYLPRGITTPAAAAATRTLDADDCKAAAESCAQLSRATASCSSAHAAEPAALTSCRCQESLVSLASACFLDGRQSCVGAAATTSGVWELRSCAAATSVLQRPKDTGPITTAAETSTAKNTATGSLVFGPKPTATTTTSGGIGVVYSLVSRRVIVMNFAALLYLFVY